MVGASVGDLVGSSVGSLVGASVGDLVGSFVGTISPERYFKAKSACTNPYPYLLSRPGGPRSKAESIKALRTSSFVFVG